MDTKWKKLLNNRLTRLLAFLLAVLCAVAAAATAVTIALQDIPFGVLGYETYMDSPEPGKTINTAERNAAKIISYYVSEENILAGNTLENEAVLRQMDPYDQYGNRLYDYPSSSGEELAGDASLPVLTPAGEEEYQRLRQAEIEQELAEFQNCFQALNREEGVYYYITNGTQQYTNSFDTSEAFFRAQPCYFSYNRGKISTSENFSNSDYVSPHAATDIIYIALSQEYVDAHSAEWAQNRDTMNGLVVRFCLLAGAFLLCLLWLVVCTGREAGKDSVQLCAADKIYTEFLLAGIALWLTLALCAGTCLGMSLNRTLTALVYTAVALCIALSLIFFLSAVRRLKDHSFLRHSMIYTVCRWCYRKLYGFLHQKPSVKKTVWAVVLYSLLLGFSALLFPVLFLLFFALLGFGIWYAARKAKEYSVVAEGAARIRNGETRHQIILPEKSAFRPLAEDINAMSEGLNSAVSNELKSERYKTELITNVSHDIRTPLTSIITYIDLLKKEGVDSGNAPQYLEVLEQKSARLKVLTDDLFDAAKATTGNISAETAPVDICSLLEQAMGELDDKIKDSGLDFRVNKPESLAVLADGRLLWRVIQNLMSNIFKYAMPESRVYIEIADCGSHARLTFKNISRYELNMEPSELLMRFQRGDASRHTEGSGLGLAIAEGLIDAQGGEFRLEIDGDLFKATVMLKKAPETSAADPAMAGEIPVRTQAFGRKISAGDGGTEQPPDGTGVPE